MFSKDEDIFVKKGKYSCNFKINISIMGIIYDINNVNYIFHIFTCVLLRLANLIVVIKFITTIRLAIYNINHLTVPVRLVI